MAFTFLNRNDTLLLIKHFACMLHQSESIYMKDFPTLIAHFYCKLELNYPHAIFNSTTLKFFERSKKLYFGKYFHVMNFFDPPVEKKFHFELERML